MEVSRVSGVLKHIHSLEVKTRLVGKMEHLIVVLANKKNIIKHNNKKLRRKENLDVFFPINFCSKVPTDGCFHDHLQ